MENTQISNNRTILVGEVLNTSWELFKANWKKLVLAVIVSFIVSLAFNAATYALEYPYMVYDTVDQMRKAANVPAMISLIILLISMVGFLVDIYLRYNMQKIFLNVSQHKPINVEDLFKSVDMNLFWWAVASVLYTIVVVIGFICLIVPGIYLAIKYSFVPLLVLDKHMKIGEAFETSSRMTMGVKWDLFTFMLALMGLGIVSLIVGLICLLVGVIPAMIVFGLVAQISYFVLYRKLQ
jgi:uncharacterized membrane protein